jgi:integrase/recombinase XerD
MTTTPELLGPHLQAFFVEYLGNQKRASPHTIASCRDTFRLLLTFLHEKTGRTPSALRVCDLQPTLILQFLEQLEHQRGNTVRSRNIRLSAIRSLFRVITFRDPTSLGQATQVLAIPVKREEKKLVGYLTRDEIEALLAAPDRATLTGRRAYALLSTMYNTGARVSELITLTQSQVQFLPSSCITFMGKGRKERIVPLWSQTARTLREWFREIGGGSAGLAFPNARGGSLSRDGVDYLLRQAVRQAQQACPSLQRKKISPHVFRHSTAMHLLQAGVDIAVIALWLGHESIETTHVYLETDLALKEHALQKLSPVDTPSTWDEENLLKQRAGSDPVFVPLGAARQRTRDV